MKSKVRFGLQPICVLVIATAVRYDGVALPAVAAEEKNEPVFSTNIFDNQVKKLPANFQGNNMDLLLSILAKKTIKSKGEFEKSIVFTRLVNLSVAEKMNLKGKWTDASMFVTKIRKPEDILLKYNADAEVLSVTLLSPFPVPHTNITTNWLEDRKISADLSVKMSPKLAKEVKPFFSILLAFRLNSEKFEYHTSSGGFFSRPSLEYAISPDIREVWFYNFKTGQIYGKWSFKK